MPTTRQTTKRRGPKLHGKERKVQKSIRIEPWIVKEVTDEYANLSHGLARIIGAWAKRRQR